MPTVNISGNRYVVESVGMEDDYRLIRVDGKEIRVELLQEISHEPLVLLLRTGNRVLQVTVGRRDDSNHYDARLNGKPLMVMLEQGEAQQIGSAVAVPEGPVVVNAPMAGRISSLKTTAGGAATEGQTLLVLEAMKMENEIAAPRTGTVKEIYVQPGALVKAGDKLCLLQ